jgi:hypothetical protein
MSHPLRRGRRRLLAIPSSMLASYTIGGRKMLRGPEDSPPIARLVTVRSRRWSSSTSCTCPRGLRKTSSQHCGNGSTPSEKMAAFSQQGLPMQYAVDAVFLQTHSRSTSLSARSGSDNKVFTTSFHTTHDFSPAGPFTLHTGQSLPNITL